MMSFGARRRCREESLTSPTYEPAISEILRVGIGAQALLNSSHPYRHLAQDDIVGGCHSERRDECSSRRCREESLTSPTYEPAISEILRVGGGAQDLLNSSLPYRHLAQDDIVGKVWMRQDFIAKTLRITTKGHNPVDKALRMSL